MKASVLFILVPATLTAYGGLIYYRLVWLHHQSRKALRHVDEQLDLHHEHLPQLLSSFAIYLQHESEIVEHVIQAQLKSLAAITMEERIVASAHLSHALHHLFRASEGCEFLQANDETALVHMKVQLAEQKIALAREYYNGVVHHYNASLRRFPANLMARIAGFQPKLPFEFPEHLAIEYAS